MVRLGVASVVTLSLIACGPSRAKETASGASEGTGDTGDTDDEAGSEEGTDDAADAGEDESTDTGSEMCSCAPGNDLIYVLSDDAEIWSYDPPANEFTFVADLPCGFGSPFSMAVDNDGVAWIIFVDTGDMLTFDLANQELGCADPGYTPGSGGFGLFGMSFVSEGEGQLCEDLFVLNYSGDGPFAEGPGIGKLGRMDEESLALTQLAETDYDGGELAGTGSGRLFAFAGVDPAKLIEYDPDDGGVISVLPLDGVSKTNASAFAFHGGDAWIFTEAGAPQCEACLETECADDVEACRADPQCSEQLDCAIEMADITDECGGLMPEPLVNCMFGPCVESCSLMSIAMSSKVTHVDLDESDGTGQAVTVVNPEAPVRIVGAASSICAPYNPP